MSDRAQILAEQKRSFIPAPTGRVRRAGIKPSLVHDVQPSINEVLHSHGQALDERTRAFMEPRFEHDFSDVRVHTDAQAAESARAVNALAYTVGHQVVFGAGQFAPASPAGRALIAHELTHVVQQEPLRAQPGVAYELGALNDPLEDQARQVAGGFVEPSRASGTTPANRSLLQRQPASSGGASLAGSRLLPTLNLPTSSVDLGAAEAVTKENPKLISIAESFRSVQSSQLGARVEMSAYLSESSKMNSTMESVERARLSGRMSAIRNVLQSLGVSREQISIQLPTIYSTSASGQVGISVYKPSASSLQLFPLPQAPAPGKTAVAPPAATSGSSTLSEMLTLKHGPLTVELPKSIALKVPIPISAAKTLSIDLKAEVPGTFSFSIAIDGLRYVRVAAKAGLEYDKDKGLAGSAGLQIQLVDKVYSAPSAEALRAKITAAGNKLTKAMQEYKTETDEVKKLSKLADVASALGDMYDAVDAAKSKAKPVPAATLDIGVKGPLGSAAEPDPSKQQPSYVGGTITIPF